MGRVTIDIPQGVDAVRPSPAGPAGTPKPVTPPQSIQAYLKREEISHASSPRLQPRTSALIGKVQEVLPTLVQKEDAPGSGTSSSREPGAPIKQQPAVAEERASQLMKDLKVDNGHVNSEVMKELEAAKACLDRASTLLMVQKKAGETDITKSNDSVKSLLRQAASLVDQADDIARGENTVIRK